MWERFLFVDSGTNRLWRRGFPSSGDINGRRIGLLELQYCRNPYDKKISRDEQRFAWSGSRGKEGGVKDLPYMSMFQIGETQMRESIALIGKRHHQKWIPHTKWAAYVMHRASTFVWPMIASHHIHASHT